MKSNHRSISKNLHDLRTPKESRRHSTKTALEMITRKRLADGGEGYDRLTDEFNANTAERIKRGAIWKKMQAAAPTVPAHASKFSGKAAISKKKESKGNKTPDTAPIPTQRPSGKSDRLSIPSTQVTPGKWKTRIKESGQVYKEFLAKGAAHKKEKK